MALETELLNLLLVFILAAGVGVLSVKLESLPYTVSLLLAGLLISILNVDTILGIGISIELSKELILLVLLPPLLFEGSATTDIGEFRKYFPVIILLAVPGLILSIAVTGVVSTFVLGLSPLIALLFAIIILPTDPVSVLALFEELGAPEKLSVIVEGESLINDGVAVVLFSSVLAIITSGEEFSALLSGSRAVELAGGILIASVGGALVGLTVGYLVYGVMTNLNNPRIEIVLSVIVAYGSFLIAEHYLHVSGVIATVTAGFFIGNYGAEYGMNPKTRLSIFSTWETAAYVVNTFIFVAIGITTPIDQLVSFLPEIIIGILLVLLARLVAVYPLTFLANTITNKEVELKEMHVLWWGGLHASIPIALVLGVPSTVENVELLRSLVYGIAAFSLIVQAISMRYLLSYLNISTETEQEKLYDLLIGRAKSVKMALQTVEQKKENGDINDVTYQNIVSEYTREKEELERAIGNLFEENPELRKKQQIQSERSVILREKDAVERSLRKGEISPEAAEELIEELDIKLDSLRRGESTVDSDEDDRFEEFWRQKAKKAGLLGDETDGEESDTEDVEDTEQEDSQQPSE